MRGDHDPAWGFLSLLLIVIAVITLGLSALVHFTL